jgi:hypothetical protein
MINGLRVLNVRVIIVYFLNYVIIIIVVLLQIKLVGILTINGVYNLSSCHKKIWHSLQRNEGETQNRQ